MSPEFKEREDYKFPLVVMIGNGSRLPSLFEYSLESESNFRIVLVISHKSHAQGINFALHNHTPALYISLREWKDLTGLERQEFARSVGFLARQSHYAGDRGLVVMAGWDLVMPEEFLNLFRDSNGFCRAINLHPSLLPDNPNDSEIVVQSGERVPVLRGYHSYQVFEETLKRGLKWAGATVHYVSTKVDYGEVVMRGEVPVLEDDTVETLAERIWREEEKILPQAIQKALLTHSAGLRP